MTLAPISSDSAQWHNKTKGVNIILVIHNAKIINRWVELYRTLLYHTVIRLFYISKSFDKLIME